jgi:hypothetical protein
MLKTTMLLAVATLSFAASSASAAVWQLGATLAGTNVVPSNPSTASGLASVTLDDVTGQVNLTGSFTGLLGNSTASHIHGPALPTVNGPVILALTISPSIGLTSGTLSGSGTFTSQQVADMLDCIMVANTKETHEQHICDHSGRSCDTSPTRAARVRDRPKR